MILMTVDTTKIDQLRKRKAHINKWVSTNPLRIYRGKEGLSLMDISIMIGVSNSTVQTWETGAHYPTDSNLEVIGDLIGDNDIEETWSDWFDKRPRTRMAEERNNRDGKRGRPNMYESFGER